MIRDITIGQYYPVDSVIHRLDPRVKLLGTLTYIISLFLFKSFTGYLVALLFLGTVIHLSRVPLKYILRGLKAVIVLLLFTIGFNIFLTPGEVLWQAWIFKITREGLRSGIFMGIRLIFLIVGSSLMTFI